MLLTFKKSLSIIVVAAYFTTQVALGAWAQSNLWLPSIKNPPPQASLSNHQKLNKTTPAYLSESVKAVSRKHGNIREIFDNKKPEIPIFLIQDIHLNPEAQFNIARLIEGLVNQNKVDVVGVEGAFGEFDFSRLRSFEDKEAVQYVAKAFVEKNILAAPSYVGWTMDKDPPRFVGIDDKIHYRANVSAYLKSKDNKEIALEELKKKQTILKEQKNRFYSHDLKKTDSLLQNYRNKNIGIGAYLKNLTSHTDNIDFSIETYLKAYEIEKTLDFDQVNKERKRVLHMLTQTLSQKELSALVAQGLAYKVGRLGFGDYYQNLKQLCLKHKIDLSRVPEFDAYLRYVLLADGVDARKLFSSKRTLEEKVLLSAARTDIEKELIRRDRRVYLTEKLLRFELSSGEWDEYKEIINAPPAFAKATAGRPNLPTNGVGRGSESFEDFYWEADVRSEKMVENLIRHKNVVFVVGGFHTDLITKRLKQKNLSYVVVSPRVTKIDTSKGSDYLSVFSREKTPLEKLFSGEKLSIGPTSVNFEAAPHRLTQALVETAHVSNESMALPSGILVKRGVRSGIDLVTVDKKNFYLSGNKQPKNKNFKKVAARPTRGAYLKKTAPWLTAAFLIGLSLLLRSSSGTIYTLIAIAFSSGLGVLLTREPSESTDFSNAHPDDIEDASEFLKAVRFSWLFHKLTDRLESDDEGIRNDAFGSDFLGFGIFLIKNQPSGESFKKLWVPYFKKAINHPDQEIRESVFPTMSRMIHYMIDRGVRDELILEFFTSFYGEIRDAIRLENKVIFQRGRRSYTKPHEFNIWKEFLDTFESHLKKGLTPKEAYQKSSQIVEASRWLDKIVLDESRARYIGFKAGVFSPVVFSPDKAPLLMDRINKERQISGVQDFGQDEAVLIAMMSLLKGRTKGLNNPTKMWPHILDRLSYLFSTKSAHERYENIHKILNLSIETLLAPSPPVDPQKIDKAVRQYFINAYGDDAEFPRGGPKDKLAHVIFDSALRSHHFSLAYGQNIRKYAQRVPLRDFLNFIREVENENFGISFAIENFGKTDTSNLEPAEKTEKGKERREETYWNENTKRKFWNKLHQLLVSIIIKNPGHVLLGDEVTNKVIQIRESNLHDLPLDFMENIRSLLALDPVNSKELKSILAQMEEANKRELLFNPFQFQIILRRIKKVLSKIRQKSWSEEAIPFINWMENNYKRSMALASDPAGFMEKLNQDLNSLVPNKIRDVFEIESEDKKTQIFLLELSEKEVNLIFYVTLSPNRDILVKFFRPYFEARLDGKKEKEARDILKKSIPEFHMQQTHETGEGNENEKKKTLLEQLGKRLDKKNSGLRHPPALTATGSQSDVDSENRLHILNWEGALLHLLSIAKTIPEDNNTPIVLSLRQILSEIESSSKPTLENLNRFFELVKAWVKEAEEASFSFGSREDWESLKQHLKNLSNLGPTVDMQEQKPSAPDIEVEISFSADPIEQLHLGWPDTKMGNSCLDCTSGSMRDYAAGYPLHPHVGVLFFREKNNLKSDPLARVSVAYDPETNTLFVFSKIQTSSAYDLFPLLNQYLKNWQAQENLNIFIPEKLNYLLSNYPEYEKTKQKVTLKKGLHPIYSDLTFTIDQEWIKELDGYLLKNKKAVATWSFWGRSKTIRKLAPWLESFVVVLFFIGVGMLIYFISPDLLWSSSFSGVSSRAVLGLAPNGLFTIFHWKGVYRTGPDGKVKFYRFQNWSERLDAWETLFFKGFTDFHSPLFGIFVFLPVLLNPIVIVVLAVAGFLWATFRHSKYNQAVPSAEEFNHSSQTRPSFRRSPDNHDQTFNLDPFKNGEFRVMGIFDGLGGGQNPEEASRDAKEAFISELKTSFKEIENKGYVSENGIQSLLARAVLKANEAVWSSIGSATTATVALVQIRPNGTRRLFVTQNGDSRAYVKVGNKPLELFTVDNISNEVFIGRDSYPLPENTDIYQEDENVNWIHIDWNKLTQSLDDPKNSNTMGLAKQLVMRSRQNLIRLSRLESNRDLGTDEAFDFKLFEQFSNRNITRNYLSGGNDIPVIFSQEFSPGERIRIILATDGVTDPLTEKKLNLATELNLTAEESAERIMADVIEQEKTLIKAFTKFKSLLDDGLPTETIDIFVNQNIKKTLNHIQNLEYGKISTSNLKSYAHNLLTQTRGLIKRKRIEQLYTNLVTRLETIEDDSHLDLTAMTKEYLTLFSLFNEKNQDTLDEGMITPKMVKNPNQPLTLAYLKEWVPKLKEKVDDLETWNYDLMEPFFERIFELEKIIETPGFLRFKFDDATVNVTDIPAMAPLATWGTEPAEVKNSIEETVGKLIDILIDSNKKEQNRLIAAYDLLSPLAQSIGVEDQTTETSSIDAREFLTSLKRELKRRTKNEKVKPESIIFLKNILPLILSAAYSDQELSDLIQETNTVAADLPNDGTLVTWIDSAEEAQKEIQKTGERNIVIAFTKESIRKEIERNNQDSLKSGKVILVKTNKRTNLLTLLEESKQAFSLAKNLGDKEKPSLHFLIDSQKEYPSTLFRMSKSDWRKVGEQFRVYLVQFNLAIELTKDLLPSWAEYREHLISA